MALPPEIAKQVVWRKKTPWFYGAAACLVASAGIIWARNYADAGTVNKRRGAANKPNFPVVYKPEDKEQKDRCT